MDRADQSSSIDFARYLSIWIFDCRQDEQLFWKTMNPSRLHALFNAWFKPVRRQGEQNTHAIAANGKPTRYVDLDVPAGNQKSLVQYLTGG